MKKKILIFSHALEIGGAERALLGLLSSLDAEKTDVDLFLMRHEGELMKYIPDRVRLLPQKSEYACLAVPIGNVLKRGRLGIAFGRLCGKLAAARYAEKNQLSGESGVALEYSHKFTKKFMPRIEGEYDLAVSFLTPHYFVLEKVNAKKKIAWIHTDYSTVAVDAASEEKMWGGYDYIASISDECTKSFASVFPSLKEKIVRIDNIVSPEFITAQSAGDVSAEMPENGVKLLSAGRFTNAKNFDNVPDICRRICEAGLDVRWYLVGYGGGEELIRQKIAEAGMQDRVIILGKKENPYPYIKACDVYVQPSRYEGKAVAVREAQILGRPVVITAFPTSASQLENGADGMIVPLDNEGCAMALAELLQDEKKLKSLSANAASRDYSNCGEAKKLYKLMEI